MVAKRIQANYDCLQEMMKVFMRHADMTVALTFQIEGVVDQLQGGAWRGVGAEAFYAEMRDLILPAMRRLEDALQLAGEGTGKIHAILREAEEEAARLFQGEGKTSDLDRSTHLSSLGERITTETLDTLTPNQASQLALDLSEQVSEFSKYVDSVANQWFETLTKRFVLEGLWESVVGSIGSMSNLGISGFLALLAKDLKGGIAAWFGAHFGQQAVENALELIDNMLTIGNPVNLGDGKDTIIERARVRAAAFALIATIEQIGRDEVLTHVNLEEIGNAITTALAAHPSAIITGRIVSAGGREPVIYLTADGKEILRTSVTPEVATRIEEIFDRYGPNFTSQDSLRRGISAYMETHWAGGVGISETIERAMRDPDMQILLDRLNAGAAITPKEIEDILSRYPVVMPAPVPTPSNSRPAPR